MGAAPFWVLVVANGYDVFRSCRTMVRRTNMTDIATLLEPFLQVSPEQVAKVRSHLDLLLKWNARMNLTALRDPEEIITRHFGESLFLSRHINENVNDVTDVGSGAGFPGIPLKIAIPRLTVTLIEAQQRKATFLREVGRAIHLDIQVINKRAEEVVRNRPASSDLVTLRAVEKFETVLPIAAELVRPHRTIALLIGSAQVPRARDLLSNWHFEREIPIPGSENRVILMGNQESK